MTVQAIYDATIQVLLRSGQERLTTVRVAERAGVSVGTLYQYLPNKQSLLFAVLEQHMDRVTSAVEEVCSAKPFRAVGGYGHRAGQPFWSMRNSRTRMLQWLSIA